MSHVRALDVGCIDNVLQHCAKRTGLPNHTFSKCAKRKYVHNHRGINVNKHTRCGNNVAECSMVCTIDLILGKINYASLLVKKCGESPHFLIQDVGSKWQGHIRCDEGGRYVSLCLEVDLLCIDSR